MYPDIPLAACSLLCECLVRPNRIPLQKFAAGPTFNCRHKERLLCQPKLFNNSNGPRHLIRELPNASAARTFLSQPIFRKTHSKPSPTASPWPANSAPHSRCCTLSNQPRHSPASKPFQLSSMATNNFRAPKIAWLNSPRSTSLPISLSLRSCVSVLQFTRFQNSPNRTISI